MAWPTDPLDLQVELNIAGTWTAATSKTYQRAGTSPPALIQRGRPDESGQMNPSSATFELNNRNGNFSPKNPLGAYYGSFGRNTPVRLSVPAQANYLRLETPTARAFVNDTGAGSPLSISGSIEMQIQLDLTDWQGCILAGKWDGGGCWFWQLNANGTMTFGWFDSGVVFHQVVSSVPLPFFRGQQALRVTMDATTGNVTFSTSAAIGGTFTTLGAVNSGTGGAATSIAVNHSSPLVVGYSFALTPAQLCGRVAEYRLLNGIGGTVAADGVFSAQSAGATSWTDSAGNAWQLAGGAEISARDYRYHGESSALPPKWDITGTDQSVAVTAGGIWRRLGQGRQPVQSPMRRALTTRTGTLVPVAYWPAEDAAGATSFGSAVGGGLMTFDGSPTLATDSSFPGSLPLPQVQGSRWHGKVTPYTSNGSIIVRWLCKPGSSGVNGADVVRILCTGTCQAVSVSWYTGAGNMGITGWSGGATVFTSGSNNFAATLGTLQQPLWMSLELRPSGGNINWGLVMIPLGSTTGAQATGTVAGTIGNVTDVYVDPDAAFTDWVIGHVSAQSDWESLFNPPIYQPFNAWAGELAANRFVRLCGEAGITARVTGSPAYSAAMGQQPTDTLTNLLQQCEDADQGQLYEPRQVLGLGLRTSGSICNQAPRVVIDYSLAQIGGSGQGLAPTYDDQRLRNDAVVTRSTSGGKATQYQYQLNDGSALAVAQVGDYQDSLTANVSADRQVPNLARWKVHVGTVDEARWPAIPFNLRRAAIQSASLYYPLLGVDVGDYVQLKNMPNVITYDPVKQLSYGLKESLGGYFHDLELNGVPESPWEVIILDDPVYGRADTDGSTLAQAATSAATFLTVGTNSAAIPAWTTNVADFPFDVAVSGERMTVTSIGAVYGNWLSGQSAGFEGGIGTWGPDPSGSDCTVYNDLVHAHTGSNSLGITSVAAGSMFATDAPDTSLAALALNALPCRPGDTINASAWFLSAAVSRTVRVAITFWTAAGGFISGIYPAGSASSISVWTQQVNNGVTAPATAAFARAETWVLSTAAGGEVHYVDDVFLQNATWQFQAFTVTRAVNGVAKAQVTGTDVRLWYPPTLAYQ